MICNVMGIVTYHAQKYVTPYSPVTLISYQTLFQYHTSKQNHKTQHDIEDMIKGQKGLRQSCPNKGFNNIQRLAKKKQKKKKNFTHIQTKIHKNTQDMP